MGGIRPELGELFGTKKKHPCRREFVRPGSALIWISPVPFLRYADARNLATSNIRRRFAVRISAFSRGQSATQLCLFRLHEGLFAPRSASCPARSRSGDEASLHTKEPPFSGHPLERV